MVKIMADEKKKFDLRGKIKKGLTFCGPSICAGITISALLLGAKFCVADPIVYRAYKNDLPTYEDANKNLDATGYNTDITWCENYRFVFPSSGKVKVNVFIPEDKQTDRFKSALESSINEINNVLSLINPKYSLEVNYDPGLFDNLYCFNLYMEDLSNYPKKNRIVAYTQTKDTYNTKNGMGKYAVDVTIDLDYCDEICYSDSKYLNYVKNTLCHEIAGHGLASMKDAYELEDYPYQTIMESAKSSGVFFSKSDLMILFSLYSKDTNYDEWKQKIDDYLATNPVYINLQKKIDYVKEHFYDEYVVKNELQNYISPKDIQFENIGEFYIKSITEKNCDFITGNFQQKYITYKGLTSASEIEVYNYNLSGFDNINYTNYSGYFFDVDGVSCSSTLGDDVYVKIGENTIVEVGVSYGSNGLYINGYNTYDLISKEAYKRETKIIDETIKQICKDSNENNHIVKEYGTFKNVEAGCANFIKDYLDKNGYNYKDISSVKNEMHGAIIDDSSNTKTVVINKSIYIDGEKYYYTISDGFVFCSNGKVLVLLENNSVIELEIGIDLNNAQVEVKQTADMLFLGGPQFNTNESAVEVEKEK